MSGLLSGCHTGACMNLIISCAAGFVVTAFLLWFLRPLAGRIGLVDVPDARKHHDVNTPLIGGLAMFVGFTFAVLTLDVSLSQYRGLFLGLLVLIVVGVLDDMHDLSSYAKFLAQITAAVFMVSWGGVSLHSLGWITPSGALVELGAWTVPFTIFSTVGVINALNMVDGMDGLAGSLAFIGLMALGIMAYDAGNTGPAYILFIVAATVLAFLSFNLRLFGRSRALIFMGDSGSMFLGFILSWYVIDFSAPQMRTIAPVTALWILAIPLFDAVYLLLRRVLSGRSPFAADRYHLHHLLLARGLSVNQTLSLIIVLALSMAGFGVYGFVHKVSEAIQFYSFLLAFAVYFLAMNIAWWRLRRGTTV